MKIGMYIFLCVHAVWLFLASVAASVPHLLTGLACAV